MSAPAAAAMRLMRRAVTESSHVLFPRGTGKASSRVIDVAQMAAGKVALLLKETPFHPVDRTWPDQPADRGTLKLAGRAFPVAECEVFMAHRETNEVREAASVPKKDKPDWFSLVAHVIDPLEVNPESFIGQTVEAEVDPIFRRMLNVHHTACHVAAVAFNQATDSLWAKVGAKVDSLGSRDLDHAAMDTSFIYPDRSEDTYRFGKSLKKSGLDPEVLFAALDTVQRDVNTFLAAWVATGAEVTIEAEGPALDDRRTWVCRLPDGRTARMPCGGSHVESLLALRGISYRLEAVTVDGERKLRAVTTVPVQTE